MPKTFLDLSDAAAAAREDIDALQQQGGGSGTATIRELTPGVDYTARMGEFEVEGQIPEQYVSYAAHETINIPPGGVVGTGVAFEFDVAYQGGNYAGGPARSFEWLKVNDIRLVAYDYSYWYGEATAGSVVVDQDDLGFTAAFDMTVENYYTAATLLLHVDLHCRIDGAGLAATATLTADESNAADVTLAGQHLALTFYPHQGMKPIGKGLAIEFLSPFGDTESAFIKYVGSADLSNGLDPENYTVDLAARADNVRKDIPQRWNMPIIITMRGEELPLEASLACVRWWEGDTLYFADTGSSGGYGGYGYGYGGGGGISLPDSTQVDVGRIIKMEVAA